MNNLWPLLKNKSPKVNFRLLIFGLGDQRASLRKRKSETFSFVSFPTLVERMRFKLMTSTMP